MGDNNTTEISRGDLITKLENLLMRRGSALARANINNESHESIGHRANMTLVAALNLEIEETMAQLNKPSLFNE